MAEETCNCQHAVLPEPKYAPWVSAGCPVHDALLADNQIKEQSNGD
jgi:hypothetical protein